MPSLASVTVVGHAGRDAEVKAINGGKSMTKFSVAHSYKVKDEKRTDWYGVTVFGKAAEWAASVKKGELVVVQGRLETHEHNGKVYFDIIANDVVTQKKEGAGAAQAALPGTAPEGDIPF